MLVQNPSVMDPELRLTVAVKLVSDKSVERSLLQEPDQPRNKKIIYLVTQQRSCDSIPMSLFGDDVPESDP